MDKSQIIQQTADFVKEQLANAEGGHDWWHIFRVWQNAKTIAASESADLFVVELGALLHDIADSKFHDGDEKIGPAIAIEFLLNQKVEQEVINHVVNIIQHISFKRAHNEGQFKSTELDIIQDADRLDALGAIGIARAFNYGGFKNRKIYDPTIPPNPHQTKEEYKNSTAPTLNHFHEKLLLLKDRMNTETGRKMAEKRHQFLLTYLETFHQEWGSLE